MRTFGVKKVDQKELFSTSTVVCVLTPYMESTHHIINEETLRMMQPDSYLVGVTRGKCVDNQALYKALTEKWIAGAALDDPEEEPIERKCGHRKTIHCLLWITASLHHIRLTSVGKHWMNAVISQQKM